MSTSASTIGKAAGRVSRTRIILIALMLGAFAVGTSEFMIGGLLNEIAASLGVPIPTAGWLITGYAAGVTFGGPLITVLTGRLNRRRQIVLLLAVFIVGNLICALSTTFGLLLVGRLVTAFCHGAFYGAASVAAGALVAANQRASALALVSSGVMIANIFGVPAGAALGQLLGWHAAFWAVSALGAFTVATLFLLLPEDAGHGKTTALAEVRVLRRPQVILGLLLSVMFTSGLFNCVPYLTAMLTEVAHAQAGQIPWLLMIFGCGATAGVLLGGRLADRRLIAALTIAFFAQIATYLLLAAAMGSLTLMWGAVFLLGLSAMLAVAPLRMIVLEGASDAPGLASTMTSSGFNLGVAVGAAVGSTQIAAGLGFGTLPLFAIAFVTPALVAIWVLSKGRGSL